MPPVRVRLTAAALACAGVILAMSGVALVAMAPQAAGQPPSASRDVFAFVRGTRRGGGARRMAGVQPGGIPVAVRRRAHHPVAPSVAAARVLTDAGAPGRARRERAASRCDGQFDARAWRRPDRHGDRNASEAGRAHDAGRRGGSVPRLLAGPPSVVSAERDGSLRVPPRRLWRTSGAWSPKTRRSRVRSRRSESTTQRAGWLPRSGSAGTGPRLAEDVRAYETSLEMMEGTANYVARVSVGEPASRTAERLRAPRPAEDVRWRFYDTGAALCLLLESVEPGWQERSDRQPRSRLSNSWTTRCAAAMLAARRVLESRHGGVPGRGGRQRRGPEPAPSGPSRGVARAPGRPRRHRGDAGRRTVPSPALRSDQPDGARCRSHRHANYLTLSVPQGSIETDQPGLRARTFGAR